MTGEDTPRGSTLRVIRIGGWILVGLALLAVLWFRFGAPMLTRSVTDDLGRGDYTLQTTDGGDFTEASLKGAPSAVFFGFTHCPDVCPTTLGDIAAWQDELAKDGKALRVFFVSVDPERDPPETLRDYVSWVPGVIGVTGSPAETDKAIRAFRIYVRKVPDKDGGAGYTMDHSAYVMLFDAQGRFDQLISYQEPPERVLPKLRSLTGAAG